MYSQVVNFTAAVCSNHDRASLIMGKKKSRQGAHLKSDSGRRPERKFDPGSDGSEDDSRDASFDPEACEDEAANVVSDSADDGMSLELDIELQALTGHRACRPSAARRRQKAKKYARRHCGYSLVALRACVPIALSQTCEELPEELRMSPDLPVSPLFKQRRWARVSWRYAAEYRKGERGNAVVWAVARQSSKRHRDTNDPRARQAEAEMEALAFM